MAGKGGAGSACHSLTSFFTSGRARAGPHDLGPRPTRPLPAPRIMSLKPAQGKLCPLGARGRRLKSRRDVAHLAHDFLQIRARRALLLEASDFRFLTEQMLIEELDAAALVRALGLILARPLGGRPLGHLSSRKAGIVRPRSGLFLKPRLHAAEGLGGSHDS